MVDPAITMPWQICVGRRPSDAIWRHGTSLTLVRAMACRLFRAKTLTEPMLTYHQWILLMMRKLFFPRKKM